MGNLITDTIQATAFENKAGNGGPNFPFGLTATTGQSMFVDGWLNSSAGAPNCPAGLNVAGKGVFNSINIQVFTSTGVYTPTPQMAWCIIEAVGGGGGGGGALGNTSNHSAGSGGSGSTYARSIFTAAQIGASQTVTIGAGGTGGSGAANAGNGTNTTVGSLIQAEAGAGGATQQAALAGSATLTGATPLTGSIGTFLIAGGIGQNALLLASLGAFGGNGGASYFGTGGIGGAWTGATQAVAGLPGQAFGAGGGGSIQRNEAANTTGGVGGPGVCIITEFISTIS